MTDALKHFLDRGQIVLHMGVHKTATTYIQQALETERAALRARGTALILPNDLRGTGTTDDGTTPGLDTQLLALAGDDTVQRIILSEENLIGSGGHNLARRSLYPSALRRLAKLPGALDHPNVTLLLALRDYGPYLSSSVTTAIRRGKVFDPEMLRAAYLVLHRSWLDVVADLRQHFPSADMRLWRYERFAEVAPQVWSEMDEGLAPEAQKRAFRTLSRDAMAQVSDRLESATGPPRQIVRKAARAHPITDTNPAYSLWNDDESAHLSALYDTHWKAICALYPDMVMPGG